MHNKKITSFLSIKFVYFLYNMDGLSKLFFIEVSLKTKISKNYLGTEKFSE